MHICTQHYDTSISHVQICAINNRATANKMMIYKHALLLFKIWNETIYMMEWLALNFPQNHNKLNDQVKIFLTSKLRVGRNLPVDRLKMINCLIKFDWLNLSVNAY